MRQEHQDGVTYLLRNILKANWMKLHRILTMMLVVSLVIHIFQMGIKLPYAISSLGKSAGSSKTEQLKIEEENKGNSKRCVRCTAECSHQRGAQNYRYTNIKRSRA